MDKELNDGLTAPYIAGVYRKGEWTYLDTESFKDYLTDKEFRELEDEKHIPYCGSCGASALFEKQDDSNYSPCLSNFCPRCGAILNPKLIEFISTLEDEKLEKKK